MLEIEFDEQNLDRMISVNSKSKENLAPDTVSFYLRLRRNFEILHLSSWTTVVLTWIKALWKAQFQTFSL